VAPSITTQAIAIVVATNSSHEPRSTAKRSRLMRPPAPAIAATDHAAVCERIAMVRRRRANAAWSIAQHASANARTAATMCSRSCQWKSSPTGTGQPGEHVTCEAKRNRPHATHSETEGVHSARIGAPAWTWRAAHAMSAPPATRQSSAPMNT